MRVSMRHYTMTLRFLVPYHFTLQQLVEVLAKYKADLMKNYPTVRYVNVEYVIQPNAGNVDKPHVEISIDADKSPWEFLLYQAGNVQSACMKRFNLGRNDIDARGRMDV